VKHKSLCGLARQDRTGFYALFPGALQKPLFWHIPYKVHLLKAMAVMSLENSVLSTALKDWIEASSFSPGLVRLE